MSSSFLRMSPLSYSLYPRYIGRPCQECVRIHVLLSIEGVIFTGVKRHAATKNSRRHVRRAANFVRQYLSHRRRLCPGCPIHHADVTCDLIAIPETLSSHPVDRRLYRRCAGRRSLGSVEFHSAVNRRDLLRATDCDSRSRRKPGDR